jgi:hypothetical protein
MAEYMPLTSTSPTEHDDEEFESLKPGGQLPQKYDNVNTKNRTILMWFTILMAVLEISAAVVFYNYVSSTTSGLEYIRSPDDVTATLRMVRPSPNLEKGRANIKQNNLKAPQMIFPRVIVRANALEPNRMYHSGTSVLLSPSDSMIYYWKIKGTRLKCYISAWVSLSDKLIAANKSYIAEGDVTAIEIWKVSTPTDPNSLKTMSWNTRPERLSLMGTVNFTSQVGDDGQELKWPTPLFDCSGTVNLTIEIVCMSCSLQFDQIFSSPALGPYSVFR